MIVEMRTYTLHVGQAANYLRLYEAEGLATQTRILGKLVGYYSTEVGNVNQIVHLWAYDSFEERLKRRAALFADPTWLAYIPKVAALIVTQESKILNPARFSPA
ncbi:MAG TPA: NIPSNAP family protein [Caulobacteraceae bacterium]|nr:NIPSNAP family protein [Caulobacteraceae bacterium]